MNRGLYRKLALRNIRKNRNTFLPFSISATAIIAMFYMLYSIQAQVDDSVFTGANTMGIILNFGVVICGIFSVFVLIYTNNFLIKRRSREFGLYSVLGMEKKHISRIVFWEIIIIAFVCITAGILTGIVLSKLMFMVLLKLLGIQTNLSFGIEPGAILITVVIFLGIFVVIILWNNFKIHRLKPVELMRNESAGEKEPKAKWLLAILGLACLGIGYYLAITTKNPITALNVFFVAVLLVMAGTYLLFLSVSIAVLKILKKNKSFYYHKKHFITVSGMMFRMKQNAVGLANICILSTCVLVVISSTVSLYAGMEDVLGNRFPKEVTTSYIYEDDSDDEAFLKKYHYDYSVLDSAFLQRAEKYNLKIKNMETFYSLDSVGSFVDNQFTMDYQGADSLIVVSVETLEDYKNKAEDNISLEKDEAIVYISDEERLKNDEVNILGKEFKIKKTLDKIPGGGQNSAYEILYLVVSDMDVMRDMKKIFNENSGSKIRDNIYYNYQFDLSGTEENKEKFCTGLRDYIIDTGIAHTDIVADRYTSRQSFFELYGSLLFIGIFIGSMFLITTVMIIYYKQLSEGYEDRQRFEIMKKVGMDEKEIKAVIKNQILLVFFLPILLAVVHICFAFDIIRKMLISFNFTNTSLYIVCVIMVVLVFFIAYGIVYGLTAKTYYKIVNS